MTLRTMLGLMTTCLFLTASAAAQGQTTAWPTKPVHLVVPQGPGGGTDILGRLWAEFAGKSLGVSVVVENKAGANGVLASSYVANQTADGNTVMIAGISYLAFNPFTYKNLSYNPIKDFDGVALLTNTPFLLVSSPDSGIKTFADLSPEARRKDLHFASAGKGNSTHLVMAMLGQRQGISLTHVPYNGAAKGLTAVMSGEVQLMADVLNTAAVQAKAGRVNALAVVGSRRAASLPDVPTLNELGLKDFPLPGWYALVVPAGTPVPVVARLNAITQMFFTDPATRARLDALQLEPLPGGPELVKVWMRRDADIWGPVITRMGISND